MPKCLKIFQCELCDSTKIIIKTFYLDILYVLDIFYQSLQDIYHLNILVYHLNRLKFFFAVVWGKIVIVL